MRTDVLTQHPQRVALHNEIHARPPEALEAPVSLSHVVMVCDAEQRVASWAHMAELARDLAPEDKKASYQVKVERYEKEKGEIKLVADKMEAEATEWDHKSDEQMHQHHRWAQSTTVLQVCIALAAIALLTKKKWLEYAMFAAGGVGLVVGALASLHI